MIRYRVFVLSLALAAGGPFAAWGQGGRRGAPGGQAAVPQQTGGPTAGRGRGAAPEGAGGSTEFYNFDPSASSGQPIPDTPPAETHLKIAAGGQSLAYTARAGYLPLRNATTGQTEAHLFYTSYTRDGVNDAAGRPVVFFLGGAPGVAAAWQEFGGLGPKRLKRGEIVGTDNPDTLLTAADLVFVNPVGTAFSRPDQPSKASAFWNTATDTASLAEFVRSYLRKYDRRGSPVFLAGEDHGTGRAAGVAAYLDEHQVPVRGVALLSTTQSADALAGDTQFLTLMPSFTMAAWKHKKLTPELNAMSAEQIAGQARQFASREYLHALYKGDRMTAEERTKVINDLSRLTGLSKSFVVANNLRVPLDRFSSELLREQHGGLSPSDSRVTGFVPTPAGGGRGGGRGFAFVAAPPIDFNLSSLAPGFLTAYEGYLRNELAYKGNSDGIYYLMSGGVGAFTSTGSDETSLTQAFARNPQLRLFVGVNYFDLNSPFYATEYTLAHLNVSPEVRAHNISVSHFEAGAMPYLDDQAAPKLQRALASFISDAVSSRR